ncbi:MAG: hypothetical protein JWN07_3082 [Hyphomicrobiales bacterium]|nr:hypothetical protein [Hyphomicrobiales bacterium]
MLRTVLLGTAVALTSTFAMAADLPARTSPAPLLAGVPFSWTGAYVGVQAGYGMHSTKNNHFGSGSGSNGFFSGSGGGSIAGSQHTNSSGALGGVQIGYNKQFNSLVLGVEADLAATAIKGSASSTGTAFSNGIFGSGSGGGTSTMSSSSSMKSFGTVRGRLGFAADRALFYVTGGLAYAKLKNSFTYEINTPGYFGTTTASNNKWKTGWTLGGGMEYALTNNWSVKTEALYYKLGKKSYDSSFSDPNSFIVQAGNVKSTGVIGRVGLNYRFY